MYPLPMMRRPLKLYIRYTSVVNLWLNYEPTARGAGLWLGHVIACMRACALMRIDIYFLGSEEWVHSFESHWTNAVDYISAGTVLKRNQINAVWLIVFFIELSLVSDNIYALAKCRLVELRLCCAQELPDSVHTKIVDYSCSPGSEVRVCVYYLHLWTKLSKCFFDVLTCWWGYVFHVRIYHSVSVRIWQSIVGAVSSTDGLSVLYLQSFACPLQKL